MPTLKTIRTIGKAALLWSCVIGTYTAESMDVEEKTLQNTGNNINDFEDINDFALNLIENIFSKPSEYITSSENYFEAKNIENDHQLYFFGDYEQPHYSYLRGSDLPFNFFHKDPYQNASENDLGLNDDYFGMCLDQESNQEERKIGFSNNTYSTEYPPKLLDELVGSINDNSFVNPMPYNQKALWLDHNYIEIPFNPQSEQEDFNYQISIYLNNNSEKSVNEPTESADYNIYADQTHHHQKEIYNALKDNCRRFNINLRQDAWDLFGLPNDITNKIIKGIKIPTQYQPYLIYLSHNFSGIYSKYTKKDKDDNRLFQSHEGNGSIALKDNFLAPEYKKTRNRSKLLNGFYYSQIKSAEIPGVANINHHEKFFTYFFGENLNLADFNPNKLYEPWKRCFVIIINNENNCDHDVLDFFKTHDRFFSKNKS